MSEQLDTRPAMVASSVTPDWQRFLPLSGVAFLVFLAGAAIISGSVPSEYASGSAVLSSFSAHSTAVRVGSLVDAVGVVFLLFFAGAWRDYLRVHGAGAAATVAFGGAVIVAVGGAARAGAGWALAAGHAKLDPSAAQTLNVLFSTEYPAIVGIAVFMFASAVSILQTTALPRWLGAIALLIGLVAIAPPTLIPLIGSGVWIAVAGVVAFMRGQAQARS